MRRWMLLWRWWRRYEGESVSIAHTCGPDGCETIEHRSKDGTLRRFTNEQWLELLLRRLDGEYVRAEWDAGVVKE